MYMEYRSAVFEFEETVEEELKKANFTGIGEHRSSAVCSVVASWSVYRIRRPLCTK